MLKWHPLLLKEMPDVELILMGSYAQKYYLGKMCTNLTETVFAYEEYLKYFPIVHYRL